VVERLTPGKKNELTETARFMRLWKKDKMAVGDLRER